MANPDPVQTEKFVAQRFKSEGKDFGKIAKKGMYVCFPVAEDRVLRGLTKAERSTLIKQAVVDAIAVQYPAELAAAKAELETETNG